MYYGKYFINSILENYLFYIIIYFINYFINYFITTYFQAEAKKKLGNITVGRRPTRHLNQIQNGQNPPKDSNQHTIPITIQSTDNSTPSGKTK